MNPTVESQKIDEGLYFVEASTQLTFDNNLRIGAGNIWEDEYSDEKGETARRITAGLWIFVRNQPDLDQHIRVHKGQVVAIANYHISVVEIDTEGVTLNITQIEQN